MPVYSIFHILSPPYSIAKYYVLIIVRTYHIAILVSPIILSKIKTRGMLTISPFINVFTVILVSKQFSTRFLEQKYSLDFCPFGCLFTGGFVSSFYFVLHLPVFFILENQLGWM